jgi:hypothetical protein
MILTPLKEKSGLSLNRHPGFQFIDFACYNPDIDTGTVPETIWPVGGLYAFRTAAAVVEVISSSAEDDPDKGAGVPGTGAHSITIWGLDANWLPVYETIALNGTAAVAGTVEFLRINQTHVEAAGTGMVNAGNITVRDASAGTTRHYIAAGEGISQVGVYSTPADSWGIAESWTATSRDATGVSQADVKFMETHYGDEFTLAAPGIIHSHLTMYLEKSVNFLGGLPHPIPPKTDVELRVVAVGANNTTVALHGYGLLIGPNADL